ncbi:hypothetical protein FQZ97_1050650 [compost metagenome]
MAAEVDPERVQRLGHGLVATTFVDAVFLVDLNAANLQLLAELGDYPRRRTPVVGLTHQQGHVEGAQFAAQFTQVAQPEIDLARRIVMGLPLPGAEQEQGDRRPGRHGRGQGAVVVHAQVGAQP